MVAAACEADAVAMTRWVVTGAGGMLGHDLVAQLEGAVLGLTREQLDITRLDAVRQVVQPGDVVINAASWTDVDGAESSEAAAYEVNAGGARNLAIACRESGARMVQVSTDYVFSGDATSPYSEDARVDPRTAYGRTKAAGEAAVHEELPGQAWVVRTAWLYGAHGPNFVSTMRRLESERPTVEVVNDQRGQPTWSRDLARQISLMVSSAAPPGIYHATASGETTWYELARSVFRLIGADPNRVIPTTTDHFPRPARRPAFSVLGHGAWVAAGLAVMRPWDAALLEAVAQGV